MCSYFPLVLLSVLFALVRSQLGAPFFRYTFDDPDELTAAGDYNVLGGELVLGTDDYFSDTTDVPVGAPLGAYGDKSVVLQFSTGDTTPDLPYIMTVYDTSSGGYATSVYIAESEIHFGTLYGGSSLKKYSTGVTTAANKHYCVIFTCQKSNSACHGWSSVDGATPTEGVDATDSFLNFIHSYEITSFTFDEVNPTYRQFDGAIQEFALYQEYITEQSVAIEACSDHGAAATTESPTVSPTLSPSISPTDTPTTSPTDSPTESPSASPTQTPTVSPTFSPSLNPPVSPSVSPTFSPSMSPTSSPTVNPTIPSTDAPTSSTSDSPTVSPTATPTKSPTESPTSSSTDSPTLTPTETPTSSATESPTLAPTETPTSSATESPTLATTDPPSDGVTESPSVSPSASPSHAPTASPTGMPSSTPTATPTSSPTVGATDAPVMDHCDIVISTSGGSGLSWDLTDDEGDEEIASGSFGGAPETFTLAASEEYLLFLSSGTIPSGTTITVSVNDEESVIELTSDVIAGEMAEVTCEGIFNTLRIADSSYTVTDALFTSLSALVLLV